jgi:hypothetical protein
VNPGFPTGKPTGTGFEIPFLDRPGRRSRLPKIQWLTDLGLTLIKDTSKRMVWTKTKMAIAVGGCLLLAAEAATIAYCKLNKPVPGIPKHWTVLNGDSEQWTYTDGKIHGHSTTFESILASEKEYHNVTLSAIASSTNREASLAVRMQDAKNGYIIIFAPGGTPRADAGHIALVKRLDGNETTLGHYRGRVFSYMGQSAKITAVLQGPLIEIRLNGVRILRVTDSTFAAGLIGLRIYGDPDSPCDATYSNLTFP